MKVTNRLRSLRQEYVDEPIDLHGSSNLVVYQMAVIVGEHLNK